jgi:hypothetical protein
MQKAPIIAMVAIVPKVNITAIVFFLSFASLKYNNTQFIIKRFILVFGKNFFKKALTQEILRNCLSVRPASQFPSLKIYKNNNYNNKLFKKYKHRILL